MFSRAATKCATYLYYYNYNFAGGGAIIRCRKVVTASPNYYIPAGNYWYSSKAAAVGKIKKGGGRRVLEPIKYAPKSSRPIARVWPNMTIREFARSLDDADAEWVLKHLLPQTEYGQVFSRYEDRIEGRDLIARLVNLAGFRSEFVEESVSVSAAESEKVGREEDDKDVYKRPPPDDPQKQCRPRPPVVTIMGHVDHGKTTLLDALRNSQITAQEFGGITQHIGAFVVKLPHTGAAITFLDTPGHAAFKSMRARGARVTDIVVLVVAADDGVMEQTLESIRFAKEAGVAMVVAINKCDRHNADVKRAKAGLLAQNIHLEEYGGDVQTVCVSALKGTNLVALQEAILAQSDLMDLRADYEGPVEAAVIEAKTVQGKGGVCSILVQRGTLKKGSCLVAGETWCRVRTLQDEFGGHVTSGAGPSTPVEVTGWRDGLPSAGDEVLEVESERRAREVVAWRKKKALEAKMAQENPIIEKRRQQERERYEIARRERLAMGYLKFNPNLPAPELLNQNERQDETPRFNVIVKGDVDGSVEAILEVYETYASSKCHFEVVSFGVGPVTENDLEMAELSKSKIYCFNVSNPGAIEKRAAERNVEVKHFNVIYKLVDDWKSELSNLLPWVDKEDMQGEGVVLKQFLIGEKGKKDKVPVAGCRVTKGSLSRKRRIRFVRGDGKLVIFDGMPASMRKEKLVVNSADETEEVGIALDDHSITFQPNDMVLSYDTTKIPQIIDWSPPGF